MPSEIRVVDNSAEVEQAFEDAIARALETCGLTAVAYAVENITKNGSVDTGNLRSSIGKRVDMGEKAVYIGTNVSYAPYVELATGIYAEGGRPTPWVYRDEEGKFHWTAGNPAKPYLAPAVKNHTKTYKDIIENELKGMS